jgi:hypothetical protein
VKIAQLAELALMSARWKQYQKETSTKLILILALTAVLALMFAPLRLFTLNSTAITK